MQKSADTITNRSPVTISIVTPSFNAAGTIRRTIESIRVQTDPRLEYVIVDGGSGDGTQDLIREYGSTVSKWISEPDRGIYDAMNKGVGMATGDYVLFLGADDCLSAPDVIARCADEIERQQRPDVWCGCVKMICPDGNMFKISGGELSDRDVRDGTMAPHQGTFARRELLLAHPFNTAYRIAADRDFFVWAWSSGRRFAFGPVCVADYGTRGASNFSLRGINENMTILRQYFPHSGVCRVRMKAYAKIFALFVLEKTGLLKPLRRVMHRWQPGAE